MHVQRVNAWSSPRNISTAFMYSFAQRPDTRVVDEPLYAHYLCRQPTNADHPGKKEILASQEHDGNLVLRRMLFGNYDRPVVLFKQMTHHLVDIQLDALGKMDNILLIRDPRAIIASYSKVIEAPQMEDIGIQQQHQLYERLTEMDSLRAVVDSAELLRDPESILKKLCQSLDIPFYREMLQWPAGKRPEDGVWAPYWYSNVHQSTGFEPYRPKTYTLSPDMEKLALSCKPYYDDLYLHALKAGK